MAGALKAQRKRKDTKRSNLSLVLGDAAALGLWVLVSSIFEELTDMLASALEIPPLAAGLTVLCSGLAVYDPICALVGGKGASFNPSQNFAFAAAGKGAFSTHLARTAAQAVGGSLGAAAALRIVPANWQGKFSNYAHGVMPGTSIASGALAEGLLSFLLNIAILWSVDTQYRRLANFAPYIATVVLIPIGTRYSGPFMNPAFAFSWFFHLRGAGVWEHVAVFWLGCLAGSYAAGIVWYLLTVPSRKARISKSRMASSKHSRSTEKPKKAVGSAAGKKSD